MTNRKDWPLGLARMSDIITDETLPEMASVGIHYVELSTGHYAPYYDDLDLPYRAAEYCRHTETFGVTVSSIHLPFDPGWVDPAAWEREDRERCVAMQGELIRAAGDAGIPIGVIHPSIEPYAKEEREERMSRALDSIGKLANVAEEAGVVLALENLPRTCLCRDSGEMLRFLREIPSLRVCFDMNHSLREPNLDYLRAVGDRVVALHVSDYDLVDERHWLPGRGVNPWGELLTLLEELDYRGKFTYEVGSHTTPTAAAENYRWLMTRFPGK